MVDPAGDPPPARGGAHTYRGAIRLQYRPEQDHEPDPGEIVWTWVAFEDDDSIGKDRPVAIVGRAEDERFVALMLSSRNHDGDARWIAIGAGPWDREGRPSWVRRDRVLAVHGEAVRREGASLPRPTYDRIVAGLPGATAGPGQVSRAGLLARLRRLLAGRPRGSRG